MSFCELADDPVCFSSVTGPMNLRASTLGVPNKLFQVAIEMRQRFVLDRAGLCTQCFPVWKTRGSLFATLAEKRSGVLQRATQVRIGKRSLRILPKFFAA